MYKIMSLNVRHGGTEKLLNLLLKILKWMTKNYSSEYASDSKNVLNTCSHFYLSILDPLELLPFEVYSHFSHLSYLEPS